VKAALAGDEEESCGSGEALDAHEFHQLKLGGVCHVGSAAGVEVYAQDFDQSYWSGEALGQAAAANGEGCHLFRGDDSGGNRTSLSNCLVDPLFKLLDRFWRQVVGIQFDIAQGWGDVECGGLPAEVCQGQGCDEVLGGVLLHVVIASGPVNGCLDIARYGGAEGMDYGAVVEFLDVEDGDVTDGTQVARLASALGVEWGLGQGYQEGGVLGWGARENGSLDALEVWVKLAR